VSAIISFEGVTLGYPGRVILPRVDLSVERGDFLAILGPNGSGKTTILRAILGILKPLHGRVTAPSRCGYSPQRRALDPIFPFLVAEVVAMGLTGELGPFRRPGARERSRVRRALAACGVKHLADRPFRELSGGQQQRTLVARALVTDPEVLILDEPTNDLDLTGEHEIMELVARLNREGRTVVMVSHLLNVVAHYATRVAILSQGALDAGLASEVLTSERLSRLYRIDVVAEELGGRRAIVPRPAARTLDVARAPGRSPTTERGRRPALPVPASLARASALAGSFLLGLVPRELALELGAWSSEVVSKVGGAHRERAVENLERALPGPRAAARRGRIATRALRNRGRALAELARLPFSTHHELARAVTVRGREHLDAALAAGHGALLAAAQLNGVDLLAAFVHRLIGGPMALVARPKVEPALEATVRTLRAAAGVAVVPASEASREGARRLRAGELIVIAADAPTRLRSAVAVPFLGHATRASTLTARLAARTAAPIVPVVLERRPGDRYELVFHPPVSGGAGAPGAQGIEATTRRCLEVVEAAARARPDEWIWHRVRWTEHRTSGAAP